MAGVAVPHKTRHLCSMEIDLQRVDGLRPGFLRVLNNVTTIAVGSFSQNSCAEHVKACAKITSIRV